MFDLDIAKLSSSLQNNTMITGGHFLLLEDGSAELNQGTIASFETAVHMFQLARTNNISTHLGILINNMGGVCDTKKQICAVDARDTVKDFVLPDSYIEILNRYHVSPEQVHIYWEKSMRNRGKKELLKKIHEHTDYIKEENGSYFLINPEDSRRIVLSRSNENDKYGIAACPLIMSAFTHQMYKDGFPNSLNFYYIDIENENNIPNYFAIEKGKVVSSAFYKKNLRVTNVYLLKDQTVVSNS